MVCMCGAWLQKKQQKLCKKQTQGNVPKTHTHTHTHTQTNKQIVSMHPLGGCPIAKDSRAGVVNHKGQFFNCENDDYDPKKLIPKITIVKRKDSDTTATIANTSNNNKKKKKKKRKNENNNNNNNIYDNMPETVRTAKEVQFKDSDCETNTIDDYVTETDGYYEESEETDDYEPQTDEDENENDGGGGEDEEKEDKTFFQQISLQPSHTKSQQSQQSHQSQQSQQEIQELQATPSKNEDGGKIVYLQYETNLNKENNSNQNTPISQGNMDDNTPIVIVSPNLMHDTFRNDNESDSQLGTDQEYVLRDGIDNNKTEVYKGLYCMDGSMIPLCLGTPPIQTIVTLAERACYYALKDRGRWNAEQQKLNPAEKPLLGTERDPAVHFTERMTGVFDSQMSFDELISKKFSKKDKASFILDVSAQSGLKEMITSKQHKG